MARKEKNINIDDANQYLTDQDVQKGTTPKGIRILKFIAVVIVVTLMIVFIAQNLTTAPLRFFKATGNFPVIALVLISFLLGYLSAVLTYRAIFGAPRPKKPKKKKSES